MKVRANAMHVRFILQTILGNISSAGDQSMKLVTSTRGLSTFELMVLTSAILTLFEHIFILSHLARVPLASVPIFFSIVQIAGKERQAENP